MSEKDLVRSCLGGCEKFRLAPRRLLGLEKMEAENGGNRLTGIFLENNHNLCLLVFSSHLTVSNDIISFVL